MHIILATDFSADAMHAAEYAVRLWGNGVRYTLLTTYFDDSLAEPAGPSVTQALYEAADEGSLTFANELNARTGLKDLRREVVFSSEVDAAACNLLAAGEHGLLVMGNRGKGGIALFGSNTLRAIRHSVLPVLAVPRTAQLRVPKSILFADDRGRMASKDLEPLLQLARKVNAEVIIGHVDPSSSASNEHKADRSPSEAFAGVPHRMHIVSGEIVPGLRALAEEDKADMLCLLHRHRSLVDQLFHHSISKDVARSVHLPLLVLEEQR